MYRAILYVEGRVYSQIFSSLLEAEKWISEQSIVGKTISNIIEVGGETVGLSEKQ